MTLESADVQVGDLVKVEKDTLNLFEIVDISGGYYLYEGYNNEGYTTEFCEGAFLPEAPINAHYRRVNK